MIGYEIWYGDRETNRNQFLYEVTNNNNNKHLFLGFFFFLRARACVCYASVRTLILKLPLRFWISTLITTTLTQGDRTETSPDSPPHFTGCFSCAVCFFFCSFAFCPFLYVSQFVLRAGFVTCHCAVKSARKETRTELFFRTSCNSRFALKATDRISNQYITT